MNIPDLDGLAAEAEDAAASGFALKALHPPEPGRRRPPGLPGGRGAGRLGPPGARRGRDAGRPDSGAIKVDGQMIDAPLIRQAEAILASVR